MMIQFETVSKCIKGQLPVVKLLNMIGILLKYTLKRNIGTCIIVCIRQGICYMGQTMLLLKYSTL